MDSSEIDERTLQFYNEIYLKNKDNPKRLRNFRRQLQRLVLCKLITEEECISLEFQSNSPSEENKSWSLSPSVSSPSSSPPKKTRKRKIKEEEEEEEQEPKNIKKKKENSSKKSRSSRSIASSFNTRFYLLNKIVCASSYRCARWPAKTVGLEGIPDHVRNHESRKPNTQLVQYIGTNQSGWVEPSKIFPIEEFKPTARTQKAYEEAIRMKNEEEDDEEYKTWEEELSKEKMLLHPTPKSKTKSIRSKNYCTKCSGDGTLFPCSNCNSYYHPQCAGLAMVPDQEWLCPLCDGRFDDETTLKKKSKEETSKHIKPKLGEIPELNGKEVYCGSKRGRIEKGYIVCECCDEALTIYTFVTHAELPQRISTYSAVIVKETGKPVQEYRRCTNCSASESPAWLPGPFGHHSLCEDCGTKYRNGELNDIYIKYLMETKMGLESRAPSSKPAKPFSSTEHLPNCKLVRKIHINDFNSQIFKEYIIEKKEPLVITNFMTKLKKDLWTMDYMKNSHGFENVSVRYMEFDKKDESQFLTLNDAVKDLDWFLENAPSEPVDDPDFQDLCIGKGKTVRMYAKDFPFGELIPEWKDNLVENLPKEIIPNGEMDILGYLPKKEQPLVWMGYFGAEGTRTPLHIDKLATIAFNLCFAAQNKGAKHWWFIDHSEKEKLAANIESEKGCLYSDNFWIAPTELEELGLKMWYHKQEPDHLVIVPPTVPHTVLNTGGLSFAVAANVLNIDCIEDGWIMDQENRQREKNGIYRFKSAIYYALLNESKKIGTNEENIEKLSKLAKIFTEILKEEVWQDQTLAFGSDNSIFVNCDECKADVFNRHFSCSRCEYDICLQCYEKKIKPHYHPSLNPVQKFSYDELEQFLKTVNDYLNKIQSEKEQTS